MNITWTYREAYWQGYLGDLEFAYHYEGKDFDWIFDFGGIRHEGKSKKHEVARRNCVALLKKELKKAGINVTHDLLRDKQ